MSISSRCSLGGAGLILHAAEQALRLRARNAKRYTADRCERFELPLQTVALCASLEFASHRASKARCAKLTFTSRAVLT